MWHRFTDSIESIDNYGEETFRITFFLAFFYMLNVLFVSGQFWGKLTLLILKSVILILEKYLSHQIFLVLWLQVIRLSAATQEYPKSIICNVHGVNPKFIEIGKKKIVQQQNGKQAFTKGAYYIGKMVWSKGYKELLKLLRDHQKELAGIEIDLYGSGEDSDQVQEAAKKLELAVRVHPGRDHSDPLFHE